MPRKIAGRLSGTNVAGRRRRMLTQIKLPSWSEHVRCCPYLDTVVVLFRSLPKGMAKELRRVHGKRLRLKQVPYGKLVALHQPTMKTLQIVERYRAATNGKIYRVDIAYDLYSSEPDLGNFIRQQVALKSSVRQPIRIVDAEGLSKSNVDRLVAGPTGTMYWRYSDVKITGASLAHYNDRPGKVEGGYPEHLELRIVSAKHCRAAGFTTLHDVIAVDPLAVFDRHVEIIQYAYEALALPLVRRAVEQERKKHLSNLGQKRRSAFEEGLVDQYRANIKQFVMERFKRAEMQFVQTAKRLRPRAVKRMKRYPASIFNIPQKLTWGAKPSGSLKYKKKIE